MNLSWETYESGLKLLSNTPFPEYPGYANICALRKRIIIDLNGMVLQIKGESFIDLCTSNSELLIYIVHIYKIAQRAYTLFSGIEQIWADQCQNIYRQFYQRPKLESITTGASLSSVDLYHIDKLIINLVRLIESFEIYCPPNHKTTGSLQDKRNEIYNKLTQLIEKIQYFNNSAFKEFIFWYQEVNSLNAELPPLEQDEGLSPRNHTNEENHNASPTAQTDAAEAQQQHFNQEPVKTHRETIYENAAENISQPPSGEHIDLTKLREIIESRFSLEELRSLCGEIGWSRKQDGINEPFSFDALPGDTLPGKARELVDYFQRRDDLTYVIEAVRKKRPHLNI